MKIKTCHTYTATIYCGLLEGYTPSESIQEEEDKMEIAYNICREYCDKVGLCLTFEKTHFIYTSGGENGIKVGLINYPRFPSTPSEIQKHAGILGERLLVELKQQRLSIVYPDITVMLEQ